MITRSASSALAPVRRSATRNATNVPPSESSAAPSADDEFDMMSYVAKIHDYEKTENHSAADAKARSSSDVSDRYEKQQNRVIARFIKTLETIGK